jgi:hypothetical protein
MPKITILCGLSPLPVCQALKTLEATEVVIIHGSENVAKRVESYCSNTLKIDESKVQLVEVNGLNPLECYKTMSDNLSLLADSALVYGPGTSVMNAIIHEVWRSADGNGLDQGQTWYVQANPSQLLPSNSNLLGKNGDGNVLNSDKKKDVVPTGLDSKGLIKLNLDEGYTVVLGKNLDPFANWKDADIEEAKADIGQGVKDILYNGTRLASTLDKGKEWLKNFDRRFQNGFFMEAVIFQVLKEAFDPNQVFHSVKATDRNGFAVLEMDVLLRKGDNHLWISSHNNSANNKWNKAKNEMTTNNPDTDFRKKFFEAKENAVRLSGKEARSITIVNRPIQSIPKDEFRADPYEFEDRIKNGKKIRRRVGVLRPENGREREYTIADRHIIVDLAELLGRNPMETVSGDKELSKSATTNLFKWIDNALNH